MEPFCMCGHLSSQHNHGSFCQMSGCTCHVFVFQKGNNVCECKHFQQEHRIGGVHGCVVLGCPCTEYNGEYIHVSNQEPMTGTTNDWHVKSEETKEPDWSAVARFYNSVTLTTKPYDLRVTVASPETGVKMTVTIPADRVENFMKNLPFYEAVVEKL